LGRSAWLLLVPLAAVLALRLPSLALRSARAGALTTRLGILVAFIFTELLLLVLIAGAALRRTTRALSAVALGESGRDPNDAPRAIARDLITAGYAAVITAHTCRPELTHLGAGFYANVGCGSDLVTEVPSRLPGLGLPSVFLAYRETAWMELEAGSDLHARLFHARQDLPGATLLERILARRVVESSGRETRPKVVATFPQGEGWPRSHVAEIRDRRERRLASLLVFVAGFVTLLSALSEPIGDRLNVLHSLFPMAVPETAAALAALAGIGLTVLGRGIRRGQRRAWLVCLVLLLAVAVLHLIKGVDVEETIVALAAAAYLWLHRSSFEAKTDVARLGRGLLGVSLAAGLTVVAGVLAIKVASLLDPDSHSLRQLSWMQAALASVERMVGVSHVSLPSRLDNFFSPAMVTATTGLAVALMVVVFRPVVQHHHAGAAAGVGDAGSGLARARAIVARHGAGTLDYFALRPDKQFFFSGDTVVAHAVYGGVCLVSPDPIGPTAEREVAWRAFRRYVDEHGWTLGGLGAGEEWLPIYRATGMHDLYVGDEAVVRLGHFGLEGGRFKGLRQAVNRIARYGYRISFHDPAQLDPLLRASLERVMTKSRRGDVERGFSMTLGRAFDPDDAGLLLAVVHGPAPAATATPAGSPCPAHSDTPTGSGCPPARSQTPTCSAPRAPTPNPATAVALSPGFGPDAAVLAGPATSVSTGVPAKDDHHDELGPPVAFCQYVPAPGIGGFSLDLMRRDNGEHPNGLMDFAVVETIKELRARGCDGLGLNFATMRAVLAGEAGDGLTQRVQSWVLRRMGDSMQIESLWRFNAKFDPDWQPRYAIYDAPENMLAIALAIAKAESFWELPVIGRFLVPSRSGAGAG
jgi:lysyl-tRNA synthetase class 2